MVITSTEFQNNFTKYINMLVDEDIFLTLDGKTIAKIIYPKHSEVDKISGLLEGKLLDGYDSKDLRMEHLKNRLIFSRRNYKYYLKFLKQESV